ncbi:hypothetical protein SteCoe_13119 [Stentor coeruleus]|uniref:Importin subunit alpha n=1 Tax=Stentor coeruleus TaxID=5963 RepID=A0A1R2C928_9CILI|nr:hypothetical protein SteCoe_13119 [Stentor coeruleus]
MSNLQQRTAKFQKIDWAALEKNREKFKINLRKSKRIAEILNKRQKLIPRSESYYDFLTPYIKSLIPDLIPTDTSQYQIPCILQRLDYLLVAPDNCLAQEILNSLRALIMFSNSHIQAITDAGIIPNLIKFLSFTYPEGIVEQVSWLFSNILSEDLSQVVVDSAFVLALMNAVDTNHPKVAENSLWALANIAADTEEMRKLLITHKFLEFLVEKSTSDSMTLLRIVAWIFSNMTKEPENFTKKEFSMCIAICKNLTKYIEEDISSETLWGLVNLSSQESLEYIQQIVDNNLADYAIKLSTKDIISIKTPALKIIGNLCATSHEHTQFVLNYGILDTFCYESCIFSTFSKDLFAVLNNISAGTPIQVSKLLNHKIFDFIVLGIAHYDSQAKLQATQTIKNMLRVLRNETIQRLIEKEFLQGISLVLKDSHADFCNSILDICLDVFKEKRLWSLIEASGCLNEIEKLFNCNNTSICKKAQEILNLFTLTPISP